MAVGIQEARRWAGAQVDGKALSAMFCILAVGR